MYAAGPLVMVPDDDIIYAVCIYNIRESFYDFVDSRSM